MWNSDTTESPLVKECRHWTRTGIETEGNSRYSNLANACRWKWNLVRNKCTWIVTSVLHILLKGAVELQRIYFGCCARRSFESILLHLRVVLWCSGRDASVASKTRSNNLVGHGKWIPYGGPVFPQVLEMTLQVRFADYESRTPRGSAKNSALVVGREWANDTIQTVSSRAVKR